MIRKERRGLMKVLAAAGLTGVVMAVTALAASAMIPKPGTIRIADGYTFKNLTGYQSPGAGTNCNAYAPDTAFSFQVDVTNGFGARDQKFNVQIFKMADLNPGTCYTEAQLENMVLTGHNAAQTAVSGTDEAGNTASYHFEFGTTNTVTGGGTETCGYFQFDMGLPNSGSFAPRSGFNGSPVSGFVLFNGPTCASTSGVSGTTATTTTTTTTTGTSASRASTLANTGGGPAAGLPLLGLLLLGSLSLMGGVRLLTADRRAT